MNTETSLELGICQCVQICEVFRVIPTLLDGDYFWHAKHDASQSGIIFKLLHFEWSFLIMIILYDKFKTFIATK